MLFTKKFDLTSQSSSKNASEISRLLEFLDKLQIVGVDVSHSRMTLDVKLRKQPKIDVKIDKYVIVSSVPISSVDNQCIAPLKKLINNLLKRYVLIGIQSGYNHTVQFSFNHPSFSDEIIKTVEDLKDYINDINTLSDYKPETTRGFALSGVYTTGVILGTGQP